MRRSWGDSRRLGHVGCIGGEVGRCGQQAAVPKPSARYQTPPAARFISVMKFRPLAWRQAHPYLVADRWVAGQWYCVW